MALHHLFNKKDPLHRYMVKVLVWTLSFLYCLLVSAFCRWSRSRTVRKKTTDLGSISWLPAIYL